MDTVGTSGMRPKLGVADVEVIDRFIDERQLRRSGRRWPRPAAVSFATTWPTTSPSPTPRTPGGARAPPAARTGSRRLARGAARSCSSPARSNPGCRWTGRALDRRGLRACVDEAGRLGLMQTVENLGLERVLFGAGRSCGALRGGRRRLAGHLRRGKFPPCRGRRTSRRSPALAAHRPCPLQGFGRSRPGPRPGATPACVVSLPRRRARRGRGEPGRRLDGLRRAGYAGHIAVEYEGLADPQQAVERGVTYLRDNLWDGG